MFGGKIIRSEDKIYSYIGGELLIKQQLFCISDIVLTPGTEGQHETHKHHPDNLYYDRKGNVEPYWILLLPETNKGESLYRHSGVITGSVSITVPMGTAGTDKEPPQQRVLQDTDSVWFQIVYIASLFADIACVHTL